MNFMAQDSHSLAAYNAEVYRSKGLGGWRSIYLEMIRQIAGASSAIEFGAGDPAFLSALPETIRDRRAVDGTQTYKSAFTESGVALSVHDLDRPGYTAPQAYDIAVCSDVFEHLLNPEIALGIIAENLNENGVLFAHVPNEFVLKKTLCVMSGRSEAIYNHAHCEEWTHPHLHRFTNIGFRKFLSLRFRYLIDIADLKKSRVRTIMHALHIPVPYCLRGGPTYACTNDPARAQELQGIKENLV